MRKKILLTVLLSFIITAFLFSATLEKQGNIFFAKADSLFRAKKYADAATYYLKAIETYKQAAQKENAIVDDKINTIQKINLWKAFYFAKNYPEAIKYLKKTLALTGDNKLSRRDYLKNEKLIVTLYKKYLKDIDGAIAFLQEMENKKPSLWQEKKIGSLYYKKKDYNNALNWYLKAKQRKQDSKIIKNIANCYIKLKDYNKAVETYQEYLKTNPSKSALKLTYKNMAALYYSINKMNKAAEYWEKVLTFGFDKEITRNLMILYYNQKKFDKALKKADKLLAKYPNSADALYYKAKIYYDRNNKKIARKYFAKLMKNPTYGKTAKEFIKSIDSE